MEEFVVETGGVEHLDGLEPLLVSVHHQHQRAMPELAPYVTDATTWRERRALYEQLFDRYEPILLLAREADRLIGYGLAYTMPVAGTWLADTWRTGELIGEIESLAVLPGFRGRGLGSRLLQELGDRRRALGPQTCSRARRLHRPARWVSCPGTPMRSACTDATATDPRGPTCPDSTDGSDRETRSRLSRRRTLRGVAGPRPGRTASASSANMRGVERGNGGSVSGVPGGPRPSIVLVDDSRDVRALVRRRLQASGFDIVGEGEDGDEAIMLAHRHQPALLVLDTSMPRVDGIEALPVILAVSPETKVVVFTGFEEPGLAERARELGAADFVEKSIPLEDLPERLTRSLDTAPVTSPSTARPMLSVVQDLPGDLRADAHARSASEQEQAVLSEHVQQFRELFDLAEIGMATLTSNGTVVRANRALAQLMSCSPRDLVGVDYGRLTLGRGEDLDRRLEDICAFGEDLTSFEHHLPPPAGEPASRVVRVTLAPIRDAGRQVLYVFAQVQDVTARRAIEGSLRRSEESFRQLVTAVTEYAIFMLDRDGHVVSWNSGAQRIKGYEAHEILGRHFRLFYPPEERAIGHPEHNLEMALGEGSFGEEGWRLRKDGSRFWASVVISPIHDDGGRHVGFAKVTRDQTEQRAHENERKRLLEQRIHLLGVTAHELRSPTAVIDGSAGTLLTAWSQISDDERGELLRSIRSSTNRLRRLAADLTTSPPLYGETLRLRLERASLTEILRDAVTRTRAADPEVQLVLDVPYDTVLHADAGRLAQALDNLLDNALRHGTPPIRLSGVVNDQVHIRVSDAGPGIPAGLVPRLFERFAMAGSSGGTGLGLYLVREIARAHSGEAEYRPPTVHEPAAFEIRLPRT